MAPIWPREGRRSVCHCLMFLSFSFSSKNFWSPGVRLPEILESPNSQKSFFFFFLCLEETFKSMMNLQWLMLYRFQSTSHFAAIKISYSKCFCSPGNWMHCHILPWRLSLEERTSKISLPFSDIVVPTWDLSGFPVYIHRNAKKRFAWMYFFPENPFCKYWL